MITDIKTLEKALRELADRCDRTVLADGSSIDTTAAHAALGDFEPLVWNGPGVAEGVMEVEGMPEGC